MSSTDSTLTERAIYIAIGLALGFLIGSIWQWPMGW